MTITYIEVDSEGLRQNVQEFSGYVSDASRQLTEMETLLEGLKRSWEGAAYTAFFQETAKDINLFAHVLEEAAGLLSCMEYACGKYVECENQVSEAIAAVRI